MILQLADRSINVPHGLVEDVLIKVGKFVLHVDFIVLDTQPVTNFKGLIPINLGQTFQVNSNVVISCQNRLMKLSFGNMTIDLNMLNPCKQHIDPSDEPIEVNMIQELFKEQLIDESLVFLRDYFDQCFEDIFNEKIMYMEEVNNLT